MLDLKSENKLGSNCTGNTGDSNRTLILANTGLTQTNGFLLYAGGLVLGLSAEYTVVHNTTNSIITFLNPLWNDMTIVVQYYQQTATDGYSTVGILQKGVDKILSVGGMTTDVNVISYTFASGSYDDNMTQTITGSKTIAALVFPVRSSEGSEEALLLQQGKLLTKDKILYTGSFNSSGNLLFDINNDKYAIIPDGIHQWNAANTEIYNKLYLRHILAGSLY